jgi:monoamine oxidase
MDWSNEVFTAAPTDRRAPDHHPHYGVQPRLADPWRKGLRFIGSETAPANGGLIEGALQQGLDVAHQVIAERGQPETGLPDGESGPPHNASMSWDWLDR